MALAAVLDPVTKSSAAVFYYSQVKDRYNLAMRLFSLVGGSDSKYTDFNTSKSTATASSHLAAANFLGAMRVYGVATIPKVDTAPGDTTEVITQVSPVFNPVDKPSESRVQVPARVPLAVCEVTKGSVSTGYMSYLKEIDGRLQIVTYTITSSRSTSRITDRGLHAQSKLASCSILQKPCLFYQGSGKDVNFYNLTDGSTTTVKNTGGMALGSQLAATTVGDAIYVYFRTDDNKLVRVQGSGLKWTGQQEVSSHEINADSNISLVVHATPEGETDIHHFFWSGTEPIHESVTSDEQAFLDMMEQDDDDIVVVEY
ncbi:hypothetical protein BGW36DRAFT_364604 [Talaromyces proteolyticus]|uniref:Fucose-specific lectin n=1 Tax=Talaromyces proteolyticus TaxID=1131652 RepID=A0AAD4KEM6_9EURO|nr:uncharacterized protein BGW36DRAFT_364604 [Talaromyces proteolyticus]KAH8689864.1 hypothetical protein BGW36DRAFT_364604 [Talaromyces proteolyticus]